MKRLKQEDWTINSQSGSHVKYPNEFSELVIVPVHGNKDFGKGLVKKIEKDRRAAAPRESSRQTKSRLPKGVV